MQEASRKSPNWISLIAVPLLAFAGVIGGIWVGTKFFTAQPAESAELFQSSRTDSQDISFEAGDLFPPEPCWDAAGNSFRSHRDSSDFTEDALGYLFVLTDRRNLCGLAAYSDRGAGGAYGMQRELLY